MVRVRVAAVLFSSVATAWVPSSLPRTAPRRSATAAFSAPVDDMVATATDNESEVSKAFKMALSQSQAKLESFIPEPYQPRMLPLLSHFLTEYVQASEKALEADPTNEKVKPDVAATRFLTATGYGLKYGVGDDRYTFDVTHDALRGKEEEGEEYGGVDFYQFGCEFFKYFMDFSRSPILGRENLEKIVAQLEAGENVVLFANHQSEADPQVVSCCLEAAGYEKAAQDMVYVAGHKVTTDPLAIPFSMGRNLICIHSKKHIDADPATKPVKQRQNMRALGGLLDKFKAGGALVWVAPSGGRDRRNVETGEVPIAPFDSKTIDVFRLMGNKSRVKTHYYSLAMVSYELCPPPDFVEAGVGEQRNVRFVPVGIFVGDELQSEGGLEGRKEFCKAAEEQCDANYKVLLEKIAESQA